MVACFFIIVVAIQNLFSQTQNHIFLKFQRINSFQTLNWGVHVLASLFKVFPTYIVL